MFLNKKLFFISFALILIQTICPVIYVNAQSLYSGNISKIIQSAINGGDTHALANTFHENIEIWLPEQKGIYSKQQARFILEDFFNENQPDSFKIETINSDSSFIVGSMTTEKNNYKICFLLKNNNNQKFIYQLRVEKQ